MRVEQTIDTGEGVANKAAFDWLAAQKAAIEAEVGHELSWERLDNAKMSRIATYRPGQVTDTEPSRTQHIEWGCATIDAFRRMFGPRLQSWSLDGVALPSGPDSEAGIAPPTSLPPWRVAARLADDLGARVIAPAGTTMSQCISSRPPVVLMDRNPPFTAVRSSFQRDDIVAL
jgi:hypothetical protein